MRDTPVVSILASTSSSTTIEAGCLQPRSGPIRRRSRSAVSTPLAWPDHSETSPGASRRWGFKHVSSNRSRLLWVAFVLTAARVARADQFVFLDQTFTIEPPSGRFTTNIRLGPDVPRNWVSPIDYSKGTAYFQLEVFTKPSATPTAFHMGLYGVPTYIGTTDSPYYRTTGIVRWSGPVSGFGNYDLI